MSRCLIWFRSYKMYIENTIVPMTEYAIMAAEFSGLKILKIPTARSAMTATSKKDHKNDKSFFVLAPIVPSTAKITNDEPNASNTT